MRLFAPLVTARKGYYTDLAAWAAKKGFATLRVDGAPVGRYGLVFRWSSGQKFYLFDIADDGSFTDPTFLERQP